MTDNNDKPLNYLDQAIDDVVNYARALVLQPIKFRGQCPGVISDAIDELSIRLVKYDARVEAEADQPD